MKSKLNAMGILLSISCTLLILLLLLFGYSNLNRIISLEEKVSETKTFVSEQYEKASSAADSLSTRVEQKKIALKHAKFKASNVVQGPSREHVPETVANTTAEETKSSVFIQQESDSIFSDANVSATTDNGHVVCIDPGHQSYNIDMSAQEPNGPGSSTMKARASTGTQGTYSGLPEYQLNLNVSLLLKDILELRGYRVVMTRTDNETAISNKERAEFASAQGAEISVRIHANGDDSHTASGALTMSPSPQNPYVADLYESSNRLSQCIINSYCAATGFANLGVSYTDTMTGINWSSIPVTIVEMGFMTHEYDDMKMSDPAFQQTMAEGIADGIDAYFAQ